MADETSLVKSEREAPLVHLVARNPVEMQECNANLIKWLNAKLTECESEVVEMNAALNEAKRNGWKTDALTRARNRAVQSEEYYFKLLKAVEAGFYIIPDFPVDIFAIRVTRSYFKVKENVRENSSWAPTVPDEPCDIAPAGEGEYRNPNQLVVHWSSKRIVDGKEVTDWHTAPSEWQNEIVFPMIAARPVIMDATAQAMALKVFDQVGVCRPVEQGRIVSHGRGDPLIIGQILRRRGGYQQPKVVSFIIGWYLNVEDL